MKNDNTALSMQPALFNVLLADDDIDDRYFFNKALKALHIPTQLAMVNDGEALMTYLFENSGNLPDILFLDLNMPRKNGSECLSEIKQNPKLKHLPVIIHSTSMHDNLADELYNKGALYYVQKTVITELQRNLRQVFSLMVQNKFARPSRAEFILNAVLKS